MLLTLYNFLQLIMDQPTPEILPLLLKNGGQDVFMCSLNSILQLLRHIPEFMSALGNCQEDSALVSTLHSILSNCGRLQPCSALLLREILAQVTQNPRLNSKRTQNRVANVIKPGLKKTGFYYRVFSGFFKWILKKPGFFWVFLNSLEKSWHKLRNLKKRWKQWRFLLKHAFWVGIAQDY